MGDIDSFTVSGVIGRTLRLSVTRTDSSSLAPIVQLFNAAGTRVDWSIVNSVTNVIQYTPTASGTYTVLVSDYWNGNTGAYNFGHYSQTITFPTIADQALSTGTVGVSASASSALPVTISSLTTTKCTVSGSTVTLKALGTCTLQANQSGDANYPSASPVNMSFNIVTTVPGGGGSSGGSDGDVPLPNWVLLLMTAALFGIMVKGRQTH